MPEWLLDPIIPRLLSIPLRKDAADHIFNQSPHVSPNHCLINEYLPGQGILPHEDGDAYHPVVATVSLGSYIVLEVKAKNGNAEAKGWRILQEPRSLLITTGDLYTQCLHGISEVRKDQDLGPMTVANWSLLGDRQPFIDGIANRETRVSLTFRDVKKVKKLGKAFGGINRS